MSTPISSDFVENPSILWEWANWTASPINYFLPTLSTYILDQNQEIDSHVSQIIAKKIKTNTSFKIFEGKKIKVIGGKYSYPQAILIAPKVVEKHQLFNLTRSICELNENHNFNETTLALFVAGVTFLTLAHLNPLLGAGITFFDALTSIYITRQSVLTYDEKAARIVGFQLAKESIAKEKQSFSSYLFSPSIDQRLKQLDIAEKQYSDLPKPSLEEFFSKTEITKE